ncbi:MAG: ABC transporter permease [Oscillospiraceae bacterium]|nr:ABC transporter permease [Oscillospiraceae bacterium]
MGKALLKRVGLLIGTMLLVSVLAFAAFSVLPGDPTSSVLGVEATQEQIAAFRARHGLDLPVWQRYWSWLSAFVTGDFGQSFKFDMPVAELVATRAQVTLVLAGEAFALIVVLSLALGLIAARRPGGVVDRAVTVLTQITMSVPNFIMGIGLMYLFALVLRWFQPEYVPLEAGLWPHLRFMVFPALAVALPKSAMTVKLLRGAVLGELGQDYVRTAYSKGNSRGSALRRHVLRNAMIPVVTFLAMAIGDIMAGSIVIEQVFGIPGLGRILITSIGNRDYPVVQAIVVVLAGVVVGCNFLADLLYRVMDPRIDGR